MLASLISSLFEGGGRPWVTRILDSPFLPLMSHMTHTLTPAEPPSPHPHSQTRIPLTAAPHLRYRGPHGLPLSYVGPGHDYCPPAPRLLPGSGFSLASATPGPFDIFCGVRPTALGICSPALARLRDQVADSILCPIPIPIFFFDLFQSSF